MATTTPAASPLSQALARKRSNPLPTLLLVGGLLIAVTFAALGYLESQKTEGVAILLRDVAYGAQISAEDVGTVALPLHRPDQLAGITNTGAIIGQYAARNLAVNDLLQPTMLMASPPDQPAYPNGEQLSANMVPIPFAVTTIGPITYHDRINLGFNDPSGALDLCDQAKDAAAGEKPSVVVSMSGPAQARPFACRILSSVRVLYVDDGKGVAYLELSPYQAQTVWALQAAGLPLWGERYGITSEVLPSLSRLDIGQVNSEQLTAAVPTPQPRTDRGGAVGVPGGSSPIPGSSLTSQP